MDLYVQGDDGYRAATADEIVEQAKRAIERKHRRGEQMSSPAVVEEYLSIKLGH